MRDKLRFYTPISPIVDQKPRWRVRFLRDVGPVGRIDAALSGTTNEQAQKSVHSERECTLF